MFATKPRSCRLRQVAGLSVFLLLLGFAWPILAQDAFSQNHVSDEPTQAGWPEAQTGVWLVTYGPGEIYWQRFGHNGIWIRDEDLGLDHVFNFGFFDFEQERFFLRFLLGRMLYFSAAQPAQSEFAQYIDENRSIRLQKLALNEEQALRLADFLVREVQPQNRDYLYDYYWNNCSTRVRDALDLALGGRLNSYFSAVPAQQNFRQHTRRLTAADFWLYLGLELVLGRPVDQPVSRWDEFFIPAELAEGMVEFDSSHALIEEDLVLYQSTNALPPSSPPVRWPLYGVVALIVLGLFALLGKRFWPQHARACARAWLLLTGLVGSAMVFFWLGTDHAVAAGNINLLLFNPLALLLVVRQLVRPVCRLLFACGVLALAQCLLPAPPGQYAADVIAAFLPINLAAAWWLVRRPQPA